MFERGRAGPFKHGQAQPMVRPGRTALAGVQEGGQALGVDLWQVLNQNSGRSTHALEHDPAQSRIGFHRQVDLLTRIA